MLMICLSFWKSELQYAYKRYSYIKINMYIQFTDRARSAYPLHSLCSSCCHQILDDQRHFEPLQINFEVTAHARWLHTKNCSLNNNTSFV